MPFVRRSLVTTSRQLFVFNLRFLGVISILLLLATNTNGQGTGETGINDLAAHAAAAISRESRGSTTPRKILVVDFAEMHGKPTELGQWLAVEFSRTLNNQGRGLLQISRGESLRSVAQDRVVSESFDGPEATACYEEEAGGSACCGRGHGRLIAPGRPEAEGVAHFGSKANLRRPSHDSADRNDASAPFATRH
jgi:hypothetical protein